MSWEPIIEHDVWAEQRTDIVRRIQEREQVVVHGPSGQGKSSLLRAVARQLGEKALVVRLPTGPDQVERTILEIAKGAGTKWLLEVDQQLREDGHPERALATLERAVRERFVLLVDNIDHLGANVEREVLGVMEGHVEALKGWLNRHAALRTREFPPSRREDAGSFEMRLPEAPRAPWSLRERPAHDLSTLWEASCHNLRRFQLALSNTLLTGDESWLRPEQLEKEDLYSAIWSNLSTTAQSIMVFVVVHGRPMSRQELTAALETPAEQGMTAPRSSPRALDFAAKVLLLDCCRDQVSAPDDWGDWCSRNLPPETISETHRRLAVAFSAGIRFEDPQLGIRALDIVEAHRHFTAADDLPRACDFARYGVAPLLAQARLLSSWRKFQEATVAYRSALRIHEQHWKHVDDPVSLRSWAYAMHYLHYNSLRAKQEKPEEAERGYEESVKAWPENGLFWSRLVLSRFQRGLHEHAMRTLDEARQAVPQHPEKELVLTLRIVERLLDRSHVDAAVAVWGDRRAAAGHERALEVEERLLDALARGFQAHVLRARGQADLFFHRAVDVTITRAGREYACEVRDLATARGPSPEGALAAVMAKLRGEADELRRALTHTLAQEKINRKRLLLGRIDLVASRIVEAAGEHTWVLGWLERREEELVFVGQDDEIYRLSPLFLHLPADDRLRFGKARVGPAGEAVGPIEELEEPFTGDPDALWREFQLRVNADG